MLTTPQRVVLLGNYLPDGQESMRRYAESVARDLATAGADVNLVTPPVVFGRLAGSRSTAAGKWLGYLDKYVLFLLILLFVRLREPGLGGQTVFHICDHSNAPWRRALPSRRTVITCHDVLAIRGSRGHRDAHVRPTRTGRILQAHILRSLLAVRWVMCDSTTTLEQLQQLAKEEARWSTVDARRFHQPIALNADFSPLAEDVRISLLREVGIAPDQRFLLHVGSSHPRKNRALLVSLLTDPRAPWDGHVCFAGAPIDAGLGQLIADAGVTDWILEVAHPTHHQLVALYQSCAALVFPSFSEGFGWPVIEAQKAGALVVASDVMPMPEVGGDGALYSDPRDTTGFLEALRRVQKPQEANQLRELGTRNAKRYDNDAIARSHLSLYGEVLSG